MDVSDAGPPLLALYKRIREGERRRTLETSSQEVDVGGLVPGDSLEVVVKGRVVTSVGKVLLREVVKALAVELVLEMLQGESVVEDDALFSLVSDDRPGLVT